MPNGRNPNLRRRILSWTLPAIVVATLGLGAYDVVVMPGCTSCHDRGHFREATAASPHAGVDCRSCHVPGGALGRLGFALRQPLHMFVPVTGGAQRDAAAVLDSNCLACHKDVQGRTVEADGLRIAHRSCAAGASCSDCHSTTAHGDASSWARVNEMDRCLSCHISKSKTDCDLCHAGRDRTQRIDSPTFAVTHGPQWRSTHGMGDGSTCVVCHSSQDCVECHGSGVPHDPDFVEAHAKEAVSKSARCASCHATSFCDACHGTPMPHTTKFKLGHSKTAAAQRDLCSRCHAGSDCSTCHEKHVHPGGAVGGGPTTVGGGR